MHLFNNIDAYSSRHHHTQGHTAHTRARTVVSITNKFAHTCLYVRSLLHSLRSLHAQARRAAPGHRRCRGLYKLLRRAGKDVFVYVLHTSFAAHKCTPDQYTTLPLSPPPPRATMCGPTRNRRRRMASAIKHLQQHICCSLAHSLFFTRSHLLLAAPLVRWGAPLLVRCARSCKSAEI